MPQKGILEIEPFDCWGINFMGPFPESDKVSGQVEVSNRQLKSILEKTVMTSRKDWARKLDDDFQERSCGISIKIQVHSKKN
jgi:hypothetical protein